MDIKNSRDFKGIWIPKEIWLNENLSSRDKVLLAEIHSLDNGEGCVASNAYLSSFFGISQGTVSKVITKLSREGYIKVKLIYKEGTKQVIKRVINVINYKSKPKKQDVKEVEKVVVKETNKDESIKVINTLNELAGKNYRPSKSTLKFIHARLNEGYSVQDLINVVYVKVEQWKLSKEMNKYLRPETLFNATKFPSYLEEYNQSLKVIKCSEDLHEIKRNFYNV